MTHRRRRDPQQILSGACPSQDPAADADTLIELLSVAQNRAASLSMLMFVKADDANKKGKPAPRLTSCADEMAEMVAVFDECIQVVREVRAKALGQH